MNTFRQPHIYYCKTHTHTQITQTLRGAARPDKTASLRAIYGHLMHNEPPISGCVGREMRCGVFPVQLRANTLTVTSSTTSYTSTPCCCTVICLRDAHQDKEQQVFLEGDERNALYQRLECGCGDKKKKIKESV